MDGPSRHADRWSGVPGRFGRQADHRSAGVPDARSVALLRPVRVRGLRNPVRRRQRTEIRNRIPAPALAEKITGLVASYYPVVIEALDASKPTLTAGETGVLCSTQDTKKLYYWTGTGWTQIALATSGYKASFDNPPASPSAYDDEFDTTSLNVKWTIASAGTTNPAVAGTVNPISSLTTPVIDSATSQSWVLGQSDNSSAQTFRIYEGITLATDCTIFVKFGSNNRVISAVNEGSVELQLLNDADSNESVNIGVIQQAAGAGMALQMLVQNNGVYTTVIGPTESEKGPVAPSYGVLWKNGNVYHGAFSYGNQPFTYLGSVTKTGVTTLNRLALVWFTANETPSMISGFDFVRYYPSITYALMN